MSGEYSTEASEQAFHSARTWDEADELPTGELRFAVGGTAGSKGVPSQGGGDDSPTSDVEPSEPSDNRPAPDKDGAVT